MPDKSLPIHLIKATRAVILRRVDEDDDTATVIYLFPRSIEITKREGAAPK